MRTMFSLAICLAFWMTAATTVLAQVQEKDWAAQGYSGLQLRDLPDGHAVVGWILPGPLDGRGLESAAFDLRRPDLIVSVNGQPVTAESFREFERSLFPADRMVIKYRKANSRGSGIPTTIDHEETVHTIECVLGSRDEWSGTIGRGGASTNRHGIFGDRIVDPTNPSNVFGAAVSEHDLGEPIEQLRLTLLDHLNRDDDTHRLRFFRNAFSRPFSLPEVHQSMMEHIDYKTRIVEMPLMSAIRSFHYITDCFVAGAWTTGVNHKVPVGRSGIESNILGVLYRGNIELRDGGGLAQYQDDPTFIEKCIGLLRVPRDTFYIQGPDAHDHIEVIRASARLKMGSLKVAAARMTPLVQIQKGVFDTVVPIDEVPVEIRDAVEGTILSASYDERCGWVVIGGYGDNRYDMAMIAAVMDPSGDDTYYATDYRVGMNLIVDFEGNDQYTGTPEQGPGAGLLGVSFIEDRAGDDRYEGELLSAGAGMFGIGMILDHQGADTYIGTDWSLGSAAFGGGWLLDKGDANDSYTAEYLSQGVGGPRGFGLLADLGGDDHYNTDGPVPSAYGTEGVHQSFSQGVAFGFRNFASGGAGLLYDVSGDDVYDAGEFSQGGAYYYGIGTLRDLSGNDTYNGNRYGQGFGVHSGIGMLIDDQGNDRYHSMTAASQGAAWDLGVGMLLDRSGDDEYHADGLAQGAAAHQSVAYLIDLDGSDQYHAAGDRAQGAGGDNAYHYHETGVFSFSLLLDLGGDDDTYSLGRSNNETILNGQIDTQDPRKSTVHGLVIDQ